MNAIELTILMPCLNEEKTIGLCVEKAMAYLQRSTIVGEVIVADNGSTDRSAAIASQLGARVIPVADKGYGAALMGGIRAARGQFIIMGDADDSYDFSNLDEFVSALRNEADLVMGNRFKGGIAPKAMPFLHRYLGNPILSFVGRLFYRTSIGDFHCGLRGFSRQRILDLGLSSKGMEFASEMVMCACMAGYNVKEVSTTLRPDGRERAPHLNTWSDGWRHLKLLMTYAPDHVFITPGVLLLLSGSGLLILLAGGPVVIDHFYMGSHFLALGSLLSLSGLNVLIFGILAKLATHKRVHVVSTPVTHYFHHHFKVEHGLLLGSLPFFSGLLINALLLYRWIHDNGSMETSVHLAFFAGTLAAMGFCIMLASFLVALLVDVDR